MTVSNDLVGFVREGLSRGMTRPEIASVLTAAGWHEQQVKDALRAFAEVSSPVPVPRPRPYVSAREAFTYLVFFVTLYISAYSLGALAFDLIDKFLPDPAGRRSPASIAQSMRWAMSWLIVTFPVWLFVASRIARAGRRDPTARSSRIRRQLTYATIFVASCVVLGDTTTLVYYTLGGELSSRFVLKVLTVAVIGGGAFAYFLPDVREEGKEGTP